ncbi:PTS system mannose-specific transporter subunit IIAB [Enterococcus pallens]|nr:PTS system mannose-specific transporter subunit IIAB [Enterococcus pallens]
MEKMEGIIHIRVDDRLIHGQVATQWTNELGASRIMVINDDVAVNDVQKTVLRMAAPPNVATSIITKQTAATNILAGKYKGQKVLIVVKSPVDLLDLMEMGLPIQTVNVGNMSVREGTRHVRPTVSITETEEAAFKELLNRGVEITTIMVPGDNKIYLKDVIV